MRRHAVTFGVVCALGAGMCVAPSAAAEPVIGIGKNGYGQYCGVELGATATAYRSVYAELYSLQYDVSSSIVAEFPARGADFINSDAAARQRISADLTKAGYNPAEIQFAITGVAARPNQLAAPITTVDVLQLPVAAAQRIVTGSTTNFVDLVARSAGFATPSFYTNGSAALKAAVARSDVADAFAALKSASGSSAELQRTAQHCVDIAAGKAPLDSPSGALSSDSGSSSASAVLPILTIVGSVIALVTSGILFALEHRAPGRMI